MFLRVWGRKFLDKIFDAFNITKAIASILAAVGLTFAKVPYAWLLYFLAPGIILFLLYKSLPKFHLHPSEIANRRIELEELDSLLEPITSVGLLGKSAVGKTTFLCSITGRRHEGRQTEKPYAVIVQLPDDYPAKYIALIDSVGEQDYNQYEVLKQSTVVCLFVDNTPLHRTAKAVPVRKERTNDHERLLEQLILAKKGAKVAASKLILVENKFDLWKRTEAARNQMNLFFDKCAREARRGNVFSDVIQVGSFTATSGEDSARLLGEIKNAL
jgi:GTP-binding protein EngB required for normal cell division